MALYQITLFYPKAKDHADTLREIRQEIELAAGNDFRILSAGEQVCAIGFATDVPPAQLRERFARYCDGEELFQFLLVEIAEAIQGWLMPGTWQWIYNHSPKKS